LRVSRPLRHDGRGRDAKQMTTRDHDPFLLETGVWSGRQAGATCLPKSFTRAGSRAAARRKSQA
jgi:hypothetical protein